ncbi:hypothetical protein QTA58_17360 [Neorhizobium sp. CSC1952]|uniref:Uncharacterized protein n=1 Tax=Xaviernesmea oryzae TaxID=464029 RepID=A0A1X7GTM2_9HYPH|nr:MULTISPECIES: hypothetical protein [Rhizobium/Agrobacterium group]WJR65984.1 hypothetical protein QTA58_17360 [Rhizobium sp. CSC1952]SMF74297.1 hypothetical protein SAMN02982989_4367 [Xaviernesmea oryzae]
MTASNSVPIPHASQSKGAPRPLDTPGMIDRLATEMRQRSGGELPHSFCVEQVKRQLAGEPVQTAAANDEPAQKKPADEASVFHAWALSE